MDPVTRTMIRAGVGTIVNPLDLFAIETAVRLEEASTRRGPQVRDRELTWGRGTFPGWSRCEEDA